MEQPPTSLAEPTTPLSKTQAFWYSLASLGCGMFFSFNNAVIPLFLKNYTGDARLLGLMSSTHSIEGAVIQPIVGTLSDRLRSPKGRRRPFIWLFIPLTALVMYVTPMAAALPAGLRLGAMILAIFLFTVFFNIAFDPYQSLMADITPSEQRGRVFSFWALLGLLGQAGILLIDIPQASKFLLVAGVLLVTFLLTAAFTKEPDPSSLPLERRSHIAEIKQAIGGLKTLRQAGRGLIVFFLSGVGIGAVLPYLTLFVQKITNCTDQQALYMFMVLMLSTAVTVLPCGWLADRLGTKTLLLASLIIIGLASIAALWVTTLAQIAVVLAFAGIGSAAQSAAAYPLMTQLIPSEEVGFYTGLQTMALSIAQPVTVVVTGSLINQGSYRAIFAVCAVSMVLALLVLATIDRTRAEREIEQRRLEGRLAAAVEG